MRNLATIETSTLVGTGRPDISGSLRDLGTRDLSLRATHFPSPKTQIRPFTLALLLLLLICTLTTFATPTYTTNTFTIPPPHDYHVCITQIDYNPARSSLEISVKLFADDIERAITKLGGPEMHLGEARELVGTDSLLSMYLRHKLAFAVDGNNLQWRWVGHEVEHDEVWCYLEITGIEELPSLQVTNGILTEVYEDQSNAVHVRVGPASKSLFFNRNVVKGSLSF